MLPSFTPGCIAPLHLGVRGGNMGVATKVVNNKTPGFTYFTPVFA